MKGKRKTDREGQIQTKRESFSKEEKAPLSRGDTILGRKDPVYFPLRFTPPAQFSLPLFPPLSASLSPSPSLFLTADSLLVPPSSRLLPIPLPFSLLHSSSQTSISFFSDLTCFFSLPALSVFSFTLRFVLFSVDIVLYCHRRSN